MTLTTILKIPTKIEHVTFNQCIEFYQNHDHERIYVKHREITLFIIFWIEAKKYDAFIHLGVNGWDIVENTLTLNIILDQFSKTIEKVYNYSIPMHSFSEKLSSILESKTSSQILGS